MKRIERIRLYPTTRQAVALVIMLDVTRDLYNALLQQRRDAYRLRKPSTYGRAWTVRRLGSLVCLLRVRTCDTAAAGGG